MSRNKREGEYCGRWQYLGEGLKHRRVGNPQREFTELHASLKQMAKWNKGAKHNG